MTENRSSCLALFPLKDGNEKERLPEVRKDNPTLDRTP